MKIAIIGYGRMGQSIEEIALERNHNIVAKIDSPEDIKGWESAKNADVAIEFSLPQSAVNNISTCFSKNIPIVVGTTGWYNQFDAIQEECKKQNGALFHATNFSVGVNLFFELNKHLAKLMRKQDAYDLAIHEIHHIHKVDAPSGTAISLAEQILNENPKKKDWTKESTSDPSLIGVTSSRIEEVPGTHTISYTSDIDRIEIQHEAKSRKGFALGAVLAAEFLNGKTGIYTMADLLNL